MDKKHQHKLLWQVPFLLFLIVGAIFIIRQQQSMPYQHNEGSIFGTVYHITYQSDKDLHDGIIKELNRVDATFSTFNKQSIISRINRNEKVETNAMFNEVFAQSEQVAAETDGAFDITVAPMVNEWGFGFKQGVPPTRRVIDSLRHIVGHEKVKLKASHIVKKDPRVMLDCSAIAKGYGSDVIARYLQQQGIKNFMVEIGGEIVTQGLSEKRLPWRIGVSKPTDDATQTNNELQTVLNVTDKAMATSGNYRNFYYKGGKKYAHTIDPRTGYPVQHNILSSTVLAKNCATADAYATSFMVMGLDGAKKVLQAHPELMAYFIYSDANGNDAVWYSPSMEKKIVK